MQKTVFSSVDECLADLREALPFLYEVRRFAKLRHDGERLKEAKRLIKALRGSELRQRLEVIKRPDGSVHFGFTPEAWNRLREWEQKHSGPPDGN